MLNNNHCILETVGIEETVCWHSEATESNSGGIVFSFLVAWDTARHFWLHWDNLRDRAQNTPYIRNNS